MGAKTRSVVVLALVGKLAFAGAVIASPLMSAATREPAAFAEPGAERAGVALMHDFKVSAPPPLPIPLPTSIALIGSSLLVLALVGATL